MKCNKCSQQLSNKNPKKDSKMSGDEVFILCTVRSTKVIHCRGNWSVNQQKSSLLQPLLPIVLFFITVLLCYFIVDDFSVKVKVEILLQKQQWKLSKF